ncbi:MAG: hypothetical protein DI537_62450 [Stutzerimonas stutzeri]|nr:MAG: hypothetical protein DI537_62450 [Stutzerimonas stutzeri]
MALPIFPAHRFNPATVQADIVAQVISGGQALSGDEEVIQTDGGGRWQIAYTDIDLDDRAMRRFWNQWTSFIAGGAEVFLVPLLSLEDAPRPFGGEGLLDPSDIADDGSAFPESVAFASPYIVARVAADAALRATTLQIEVTQGARIVGGETFSVGERAYRIERVLSSAGDTATCRIKPPLRASVAVDNLVNFDWPVVRCRGVVGQDLGADVLNGQFATVAISFVEDFSE